MTRYVKLISGHTTTGVWIYLTLFVEPIVEDLTTILYGKVVNDIHFGRRICCPVIAIMLNSNISTKYEFWKNGWLKTSCCLPSCLCDGLFTTLAITVLGDRVGVGLVDFVT